MIDNRFIKNYPFVICIILLAIHYLASYPGRMTGDSYHQFSQSISLVFDSHHPPIMAMLWSVFNYIYKGPQTMLFLHLSMIWGSSLLLYQADKNNKFRWLYFIIPFTPAILTQSDMIWKDNGFTNSFLLVFAICTYYSYKPTRPNILILATIFIICFYGEAIKFQAKFVTPVLLLFVTTLITKSWLKRIIISIIFSTIIIGTNTAIIRHYSSDSHGEQIRQIFDIAAIAVDIDDDSVFPDYVKEDPIYSFAKVKEAYTFKTVNYLYFVPETKIYNSTLDEDKLAALNTAFYHAVLSHPIAYLKHRTLNFLGTQGSTAFEKYNKSAYNPLLPIEDIHQHHRFEKNYLQELFIEYLIAAPAFLMQNILTLILLIIIIGFLLFKFKNQNREYSILSYMVALSMVFSLTIFLTTMASDHRYYLFVRTLVFFTMPIFLKFILFKNKDNA
ncbi:MAG: hypothetical protein HRU35_02885 [Rickettsiaceae bacterium]|nr:hypothetical protein [Rickettsiaceae bacterium]